MNNITNTKSAARPILIGGVVVVATILIGGAVALAMGLNTPFHVMAKKAVEDASALVAEAIVSNTTVSGTDEVVIDFADPVDEQSSSSESVNTASVETSSGNSDAPNPTCTITANKYDLYTDEALVITWTTEKAIKFSINNGVGELTPVSGGSVTIQPPLVTDRAYRGTAWDANAEIGVASDCLLPQKITVTERPTSTPAPKCTITANKYDLYTDEALVITWTTEKAIKFSINNGVGELTPVSGGSVTIQPPLVTDRAYRGTAWDANAEIGVASDCLLPQKITVTERPTEPEAPTCTLKAIPPSTLTMSAIDYNNDGTLNDADAQYLLEVAVGTKSCPAGKICDVTGDKRVLASDAQMVLVYVNDPSRIGALTFEWRTNNAIDFSIDRGIGNTIIPIAIGTKAVAQPTVTTTYTGTATAPDGRTGTCQVTVVVDDVPPPTGGGCTLTQGYWKTHNDSFEGGAKTDATWSKLGALKEKTIFFISGQTWYQAFWTEPSGNVYYQLAHQYMAAKLNLLKGAGMPAHVQTAFNSATNLLEVTSPTQAAVYGSSATWVNLAGILGSYNEGKEGVAHCGGTPPPPPPPPSYSPSCALSAAPETIAPGESTTLSWTSSRATTLSIDNDVGSVTPVSAGSTTVSPTITTTYKGTVTGNGKTAYCTKTVIVIVTPPAPACTLTASPTSVSSGSSSSLTWTTSNATSFSINGGIGGVSQVAGGSTTTPAITGDTTFVGTATGTNGQTVTCSASVDVSTPVGDPSCSMTISPSSYVTGGSATLSWSGSKITSVDIDKGIATATTSSGSVQISPSDVGTHTYTGKFLATNGETLTCNATVEVTSAGCTSNCGGGGSSGGGGGGGSRPRPNVLVSAIPRIGEVAGSYVYLSEIPYTGIDLGPVGTAVYWTALIAWSLLLAYIVLFNGMPALRRKAGIFGERVSLALNAQTVPAHAAPAVQRNHFAVNHQTSEPETYSAYDGFKSFGKGESLSIEDIVKGLARAHKIPETTAHTEPVYDRVEPIYENVEQVHAPEIESAPQHEAPTTGVAADVRGFTQALLTGDRAGVFAGLRQHVRGGGSPEALVSKVAFLLDDAYRARVEGAACDPDIARQAARLNTAQLEQLVTSLTTAIDSSYTTGATGAKLALTRALATLGA